AWDRARAREEVIRETTPIWNSVIKSFVERGFLITKNEQDRVWSRLRRLNKPLNAATIRQTVLHLYPEAAETAEEHFDLEAKNADPLPTTTWLQHFGLGRVRDNRGLAPTRRI